MDAKILAGLIFLGSVIAAFALNNPTPLIGIVASLIVFLYKDERSNRLPREIEQGYIRVIEESNKLTAHSEEKINELEKRWRSLCKVWISAKLTF